jgi:hypothetical protein
MHVWRAVHISTGCTVGVWEEGGRGAGLVGRQWFVGKRPGLPEQRTRKGVTRQPAPSFRPGPAHRAAHVHGPCAHGGALVGCGPVLPRWPGVGGCSLACAGRSLGRSWGLSHPPSCAVSLGAPTPQPHGFPSCYVVTVVVCCDSPLVVWGWHAELARARVGGRVDPRFWVCQPLNLGGSHTPPSPPPSPPPAPLQAYAASSSEGLQSTAGS